MKKFALKHGILAGIAILAIAAAVPAVAGALPARAEEAQGTTQTTTETTNETTNENETTTENEPTAAQERATAEANAKARLATAEKRLAADKLKVCEDRQQVITNIMTRLGDRGQKQLDLFTTIAQRTEKFYTEKGKTLSNYDALVAAVNTKQAAAQAAVSIIKSTSVDFKCDGTDPKGVAAAFKDNLKVEIAALKEYRTAVKNLIVGVKSVQGTTSSTDSTSTSNTNGGTN